MKALLTLPVPRVKSLLIIEIFLPFVEETSAGWPLPGPVGRSAELFVCNETPVCPL